MFDTVGEYVVIVVSALTLVVVKSLLRPPKPSIFNVYRQPSSFYWLKVAFMFIILSLRKLKEKVKPSKRFTDEELDKSQPFSYHDKAVDAVYFNAGNSQGDYFVSGTARRKENLVDGFLFIKVNKSGLGILESPKVPSTSLYKTGENDDFGAEGLIAKPLLPMKKWKITYNGKMKTIDTQKLHDVSVNVEWISDLPYFNYDSDMDPLAMARNMALEPWSREYFETLKITHQTHYEQFGILKGTITIDNKEYHVCLDSARDHSFGLKREWEIFHRYALHFIHAENGDRFAVSKISVPIMFSDLTIGFVYCSRDKKNYPIRSCDLKLYQFGEDHNPPKDYAFSFTTSNNKEYTIQVNIKDSPFFFISKNWECKVFEQTCTASVNGKKAWGITEWEYRNIAGKNK